MSNNNPPIGVGLLGLGSVGAGVAEALFCHSERLLSQSGIEFDLKHILVRNVEKNRPINIPSGVLTQNPDKVLADSEIQIIIELIGGIHPASEYVRQALRSGKDVITANKDLVAREGPELFELARKYGRSFRFEAAVCGGMPIIGPITRDLQANDFRSIHAILNGTTNFIITSIEEQGTGFDEALDLARTLGYAESDSSNDISGLDAANKLAIIATLAFRNYVDPAEIYCEGIQKLESRDFLYAKELGYGIKLLAMAEAQEDGILVRVHPSLVPESHLLAKVSGIYNAVQLDGNYSGSIVFHAQGAGRWPTTSAILGELLDVGKGILTVQAPHLPLPVIERNKTLKNILDLKTSYYFRMTVSDEAGVFGQIAAVLGSMEISIASVIQKDADTEKGTAEIVITTHSSREYQIQQSLAILSDLPVVVMVNNVIRIEELSS
mgnify:CR=1 FL=1